jgi:hypothetical protein
MQTQRLPESKTPAKREKRTCRIRYRYGIQHRFLHFQLVSFAPTSPSRSAITGIVQDSFDLRPATPCGSISGSILGNDQIHFGNVAST